MPSGPMSTMTGAVVPAPPGVFATSMPIELPPSAASPGSSTEDRDSISSNESHRRTSMVNGGSSHSHLPPTFATANSTSPATTSQFVIDSSTKSPANKLRKKTKSNRNRVVSPNGLNSSPVNKPLKVTIRRTAPHSHTLDPSEQDRRRSPSSVYSSVPGDDERSPIMPSGLTDGEHHHSHPRSMGLSPKHSEKSSSKPLDYYNGRHPRKDVATSTMNVGTCTEPDLLAPCEAGSKILLEGVVWLETPGMMVINAQWRGKSYLGTLLDASQNTLGPSCPDKMVTALSAFKGRSNWGASHYSGSHYHQRIPAGSSAGSPAPGVVGGSIKTRSAIAQATSEDGHPSPVPLSTTRRRPLPGSSSGRGRKRRRGGGAHHTSVVSPTPPSTADQDDVEANTPLPSDTTSTTEFACPQPGCGKLFSDILGVRFHLDLVHSLKQRQTRLANEETGTSVFLPTSGKYEENPTAASKQQPSEPPRLAKAKSNTSSFSRCVVDEDQPPPQLDRGPLSDEIEQQCGIDSVGNHPPPAPSPAYSDISDDGPSLPRPTTSSRPVAVCANPPPTHPHAWVSSASVTQPQAMDWSAHRGGGGLRVVPTPTSSATGKPQYDFNGLGGLEQFAAAAAAASVYSHHTTSAHHRQQQQQHHHVQPPPTLHIPASVGGPGVPSAVPPNSQKLFQAHLATFMAGVTGTYGCPPPPPLQPMPSRQSPHPGSSSTLSRHPYNNRPPQPPQPQ